MKHRRLISILIFVSIICAGGGSVSAQKRASLTQEQQDRFLARRLRSGAITGTFSAWGGMLFGLDIVTIHTNDKEIGDTELHSPFPDFYKPTIREMLNAIALQTRSSWKYDSQTDYWVFAKPAVPKPLSVTLADGWVANDRGIFVGYKPPTYPVGMDIYYYGTYSSDDASQQALLWERVRNSWATGFASKFKHDVTINEMHRVSIDGVEALFFQTAAPRPGIVWRQWALVKNGHAFVIVSTLPGVDKHLLADVESMVRSFRVTS
jgi:hypothetical protein